MTDKPRRGALVRELRDRLRVLDRQLSLLNHVVGARLGLRDVDLDCLDLVQRFGPVSPSELARRSGVHPATMTGVLDRLQRAGWVDRERDPDGSDRRSVVVTMRADRAAEVFRHYTPMIRALEEICGGYSEPELALLNGFLDRVARAGEQAVAAVDEG